MTVAANQDLLIQLHTNVPAELRERDQWVVWRFERRGDKLAKVPYGVSGSPSRSNDPSTWNRFDKSMQALASDDYSGIGYMFSRHDPFVGIDFDKCIKDGKIDRFVRGWIITLDSYTEISQSGTGLHVIARGKLPAYGRKNSTLGVEMYEERRFFAITGNHLPTESAQINFRQVEIQCLHEAAFPSPTQQPAPFSQAVIPLDDRSLLHRMFASRNGAEIKRLWEGGTTAHDSDQSAADLALCNHLAFWTGRDAERIDRLFRQSGLMRPKWDKGARIGETYGAGTIARAIAGTHNTYGGR